MTTVIGQYNIIIICLTIATAVPYLNLNLIVLQIRIVQVYYQEPMLNF